LSRITTASTSNNSTLKKKKSSSNVDVTASVDEDDDGHAIIANTTNVTEPLENNNTVISNHNDNNAVAKDKEEDPLDSILSDISSWMKSQQSADNLLRDESEDDYQSHHQRSSVVLRRPFVTLTYAQTLDGMIAAKLRRNETTSTNMKISSPQSLTLTHKLRRMHDAILVGGGTFALDEPRLNVRLNSPTTKSSTSSSIPNMQHEQPMPIVLDTHLRHLQQILFGKTFPISTDSTTMFRHENEQNEQNENENDDDGETETPTIKIPLEMSVECIRAQNPIICWTYSKHSKMNIFKIEKSVVKRVIRSQCIKRLTRMIIWKMPINQLKSLSM
jgi:riboflavin biosynthesis pyrimidine reductase